MDSKTTLSDIAKTKGVLDAMREAVLRGDHRCAVVLAATLKTNSDAISAGVLGGVPGARSAEEAYASDPETAKARAESIVGNLVESLGFVGALRELARRYPTAPKGSFPHYLCRALAPYARWAFIDRRPPYFSWGPPPPPYGSGSVKAESDSVPMLPSTPKLLTGDTNDTSEVDDAHADFVADVKADAEEAEIIPFTHPCGSQAPKSERAAALARVKRFATELAMGLLDNVPVGLDVSIIVTDDDLPQA